MVREGIQYHDIVTGTEVECANHLASTDVHVLWPNGPGLGNARDHGAPAPGLVIELLSRDLCSSDDQIAKFHINTGSDISGPSYSVVEVFSVIFKLRVFNAGNTH